MSHSVITWTVLPPGSSAHGILQARMLEWVAIPFSRCRELGVCPNHDKVTGWERKLQGSSFSHRAPRGPNMFPLEPPGWERNLQAALPLEVVPGAWYVPFFLSVLLLLDFLLISGNIIYSNKASLEKSKPFLEMLMIALAQDMTINIKSAKKRSQV